MKTGIWDNSPPQFAQNNLMKKVDAAKHSGLGTATMFANR